MLAVLPLKPLRSGLPAQAHGAPSPFRFASFRHRQPFSPCAFFRQSLLFSFNFFKYNYLIVHQLIILQIM